MNGTIEAGPLAPSTPASPPTKGSTASFLLMGLTTTSTRTSMNCLPVLVITPADAG